MSRPDGGLEVGAGEAGVRVGAVLLQRPAAVTVGEAGLDPREVVLHPLGLCGGGVGVVVEDLPLDVDSGLLVALKGLAHRGVVQAGVHGSHERDGVAQDALHDVLGYAGVDEAGSERVAEMVGGGGLRTAAVVVEADLALPGAQTELQGVVGVGQGCVGVVVGISEQPPASIGPGLVDQCLLSLDDLDGFGAKRHMLFDADLVVVETQAGPADAVGHERVEGELASVAHSEAGLDRDDDQVAGGGFELDQVVERFELGHDSLADVRSVSTPTAALADPRSRLSLIADREIR
jgi:hypothetical protein